jgi:cellulose synthase/poly-beta-1,6-N-acetylglucosamine synthase-like glycosyltransferase
MNPLSLVLLIVALVLFGQSLLSLYLMLYSWEHPERLRSSRPPASYLSAKLSFSVLLPARHEEAVIYETIRRVWTAHYPSHLLEIAVICHADDTGTVAEAQRAIRDIGSRQIYVVTFSTPPINKPHGLNVGFQRTSNQIVTIFDAEDDIDPNIFNMVNTVILKEGVGIVQAGVQLMNFNDHWFGIHNCLEYFFWFKSRLHFHSKVGMIPLGGNTVFIRRDLIAQVGGWDDNCLTEDADIGLRLSLLGEPIRVVYDAQHVTREETPDSTSSFIRQRTRWHQGFLQILKKGMWLKFPRISQRLLAFYTLSFPIFQAVLILLWPATIIAILFLKATILVAILSFLPLYALLLQFLVTAVGAFIFTKEYGLKFSFLRLIGMAITFLPFQWLQGISAVRGVHREAHNQNNWEKTRHVGAHRQQNIGSSFVQENSPAHDQKRDAFHTHGSPTS